MKKVELNESLFEKIPSSVIGDILSRVSTKSCMNCKLVCKEWYLIIIDPEFSASRSSRYRTLMLDCSSDDRKLDYMLLDLDKSSKIDEVGNLNVNADAVMKFTLNIPYYNLTIINECNGLMCLNSLKWSPYIVCNLLTGENMIVEQVYDPTCSVEHYGLGCCPVSKQFKVLKALRMRSGKNVAKIQTLGSNEWRDVGDAPLNGKNNYRCDGSDAVFLHGSLRWYFNIDDVIWSFHFGNEQFVQVPKSVHMNAKQGIGRLCVFESRLCFSFFSGYGCLGEIWLMEEYGMKDSWVKQFCFNVQLTIIPRPLFRMDNGQILVSHKGILRSFDTYSSDCMRVKVPGVQAIHKGIMCDAKFAKFN